MSHPIGSQIHSLPFVEASKSHLTYWGMTLYALLCLGSMATMSIGVGLLLGCIVFEEGGPRRLFIDLQQVMGSPQVRQYGWASLFLVLACGLSLGSAQGFPLSFVEKAPKVHWLKDFAKMGYFVLPVLWTVGWLRLSEEKRRNVFRVWLMTFGVLSVIGVIQFFTGWPRAQPNPLLPGYYHPVLLLGHHLSVASIWIFPFFSLLEIFYNRTISRALGLPRSLVILFILCGIFTLVLGYSRTLWVALPFGLVIWAIGRLPKKAAIAFLGLMIVGVGISSQAPVFQRRLKTLMGVQDRVELWKANLKFFQERPFFGVGLGKNQELSSYYFKSIHPEKTDFFVGHAHNTYLEVLAGLGLVGLMIWIYWIFVLFRIIWSGAMTQYSFNLSWGFFCALTVYMINGTTQVNFWEGKVLHQLMWMIGMILPVSIGTKKLL